MAFITVTNTFTNGTTADATQVNTNFTDLIAGLSDGTKDINISAFTAGGVSTLNGNTTIGATSANTLSVVAVATFSSAINITPTTNQIVLGTTNKTTISATAPAASRTYTIPDAGANADFVMTKGAKTISGDTTFANTLAAGNVFTCAGTATFSQALIMTQATDSRTGSITQNSLSLTAPLYRYVGAATVTLNGLYTATEGTMHWISNETGNTMTINQNSGSASATDRFQSPTVTVPTNNVIPVMYMGARWFALKPSA